MNTDGKFIFIDSAEEISLFFNELQNLQLEGTYIFRGISNETQFSPSLFRSFQKVRNESQSYTEVWDYEKELLTNYAKYSIQFLPSNLSCVDWVVSAQHFGLPTRFLDWTLDPFIGLFFSVFYEPNPQDEYYQLLIINKNEHFFEESSEMSYVNPVSSFLSRKPKYAYPLIENFFDFVDVLLLKMGYARQDEKTKMSEIDDLYLSDIDDENIKDLESSNYIQELKEKINPDREPKKLFFCTVNHSNSRIVAQKGLVQIPLTFGYGAKKGWIKEPIINGCNKIYKIKKELRQEILVKLSSMGVNSINLFPDLQNICEHIKRTTWNNN